MFALSEFAMNTAVAIATVGSFLIVVGTKVISMAAFALSKRRAAALRAERIQDSKRFALAIIEAAAAEAESRLLDYQFVRRAFHLRPIISKGSVSEILRNAEVFPEFVLEPLVRATQHMRLAEEFRKELNRAIDRPFPEDRLSAMFDDYRSVLEAFVEAARELMAVLGHDLQHGSDMSKYPPLDHGLFGRIPH